MTNAAAANLAQRRTVGLGFHLRRMNTAVEVPDFIFSKAENNLNMLFHRNIAYRDGARSHFQVSVVVATGTQFDTLRRAGRDAKITAGTQVAHHGMHGAGCADNGIDRAGLNTFGAADAVIFVNHREHACRLGFLFIAIDGCGSTFSRRRFLASPLRRRGRSG
jgi:hypothetical protein